MLNKHRHTGTQHTYMHTGNMHTCTQASTQDQVHPLLQANCKMNDSLTIKYSKPFCMCARCLRRGPPFSKTVAILNQRGNKYNTKKKNPKQCSLTFSCTFSCTFDKKRKPTPHSIAPGSTAAAPFVIVQHPIWMVVDNDDVGGRGQRFAQCVKICLSTTREKTKTPSRVIFVVKFW